MSASACTWQSNRCDARASSQRNSSKSEEDEKIRRRLFPRQITWWGMPGATRRPMRVMPAVSGARDSGCAESRPPKRAQGNRGLEGGEPGQGGACNSHSLLYSFRMGIMDFVKGGIRELAIARPDQAKGLVVYKHPDRTIPMKAQLTVGADEGALFFRDGKLVGQLPPGRHT